MWEARSLPLAALIRLDVVRKKPYIARRPNQIFIGFQLCQSKESITMR